MNLLLGDENVPECNRRKIDGLVRLCLKEQAADDDWDYNSPRLTDVRNATRLGDTHVRRSGKHQK